MRKINFIKEYIEENIFNSKRKYSTNFKIINIVSIPKDSMVLPLFNLKLKLSKMVQIKLHSSTHTHHT